MDKLRRAGFAFFSIFILLIATSKQWLQNTSTNEICHTPCNGSTTDSYVEKYCNLSGFHMKQRCCYNQSQVVGLDLHDCDLSAVPSVLQKMNELNVLLLHENPLEHVHNDSFRGLTHLSYLSLPSHSSCPGGSEAWGMMSSSNSSVICENEINICTQDNYTCPNNSSYCVSVGPGMVECLCDAGFHGYKCMQQGEFPFGIYFGSLASATAVLSFVMFCIQGKKKFAH